MDFISASSHLMRTCRNGSIPKKRSIVRLALDTDTHSFITHHSSFIILLKNSAKFCGSIEQVSQEYLWLLAIKHNIEPFAHGKRQGHSPFELLGIDLGTNDWVDLARTYQP